MSAVFRLKDVHDLDSTPDIFKVRMHDVAASSVGVLVADIHGSIHLLNRDFKSTNSWIAHVGGRVTHMVERRGMLVTLGEEDAVRSPLLKIWDLENKDKKSGAPNLLRSTKVQLSNRPHPVTIVALSSTLSHLVIGLGDGTFILCRHPTNPSPLPPLSLPKARTIHESPTEPITGLGDNTHYLFIVTTNRVRAYKTSGRNSGGTSVVVDEIDSGLGRNVVVARDEAIYLCGIEGRGTCYAYEEHKSSVHTHLNYLVIVSPTFFPLRPATETDMTKVKVFDPENKLWGQVYVLSNGGSLVCLQEKSTASKLDMLYRKSLYGLALNLAATQKLDESSVADIHRQYGDHLYAKSDWDGAMGQYVQPMGHLQPSCVIRKYLDAQRINNPVTYLQELHSLGLANADHTTLLLNTYTTKLKYVARLDSFIKTESRRNAKTDGGDSEELPFDLVTAIRVCRQAGYFEHASYLAKKHDRHEDYLRIQIEDAGNFADALVYLRQLGPEAAENNLARYGRAMLQSLPEETTQLLIDLCTTTGPLVPSETADTSISPSGPKTAAPAPSYLSYLALNRGTTAATIVSSETAMPSSPSIKTVRAKTASRRKSVHEASVSASGPSTSPPLPTASSIVTRQPPTASVPVPVAPPVTRVSPRIYFPHFVDHMGQFVVFLETVAMRRWGQSVNDRPPGSIGLYKKKVEFDEKVMREKGMRVLRSNTIPYDSMHALILCSSYGFTDGLVLLWEKMGMYEDVLRFWMDKDKEGNNAGASHKVVEQLMHYGTDHPRLYPLMLRFLTSTAELLARHQEDVNGILEYIDEELMPPLGVIQVLSRNGVASVGLVKEWLVTRIKESRSEIQNDQEFTKSYRLETAARLKQVQELTSTEEPRVFHVTRCTTCLGQLDLPSVHFMCNHSYHQRCITENETECPACVREHALADQHEVFLSEVQESGLEAIASAYGTVHYPYVFFHLVGLLSICFSTQIALDCWSKVLCVLVSRFTIVIIGSMVHWLLTEMGGNKEM
ncbi:hypothetical protein BDZ97DRAFT_1906624 [Flammula alnicola]|nr:hypothetical protein BDZ97DRAFT_1906624 [Flammula alnicola]